MLESREMFGDGPEMGQHIGKDTSLIRARYTVRLVAEIVDHGSSIRAPGTSFHPPRGIVDSHQPYPRLQRTALSGIRLTTRSESCSHEVSPQVPKHANNAATFSTGLQRKGVQGH
jgi:hypothetical protein